MIYSITETMCIKILYKSIFNAIKIPITFFTIVKKEQSQNSYKTAHTIKKKRTWVDKFNPKQNEQCSGYQNI